MCARPLDEKPRRRCLPAACVRCSGLRRKPQDSRNRLAGAQAPPGSETGRGAEADKMDARAKAIRDKRAKENK